MHTLGKTATMFVLVATLLLSINKTANGQQKPKNEHPTYTLAIIFRGEIYTGKWQKGPDPENTVYIDLEEINGVKTKLTVGAKGEEATLFHDGVNSGTSKVLWIGTTQSLYAANFDRRLGGEDIARIKQALKARD